MKRPVSNRLGMYDDIRTVLDAALKSGGGIFRANDSFGQPSHGAAIHWRQRAYKFRKLYAQTIANDSSLAMSPYDKLTLPQIADGSCDVIIKVRTQAGTFMPNTEPYKSDVGPEDELFDVAREIADKIAKGDM